MVLWVVRWMFNGPNQKVDDILEPRYGSGPSEFIGLFQSASVFVHVYLLCCDLDEFFKELHTFAEGWAQKHFGHHPLLSLVTALQQLLQRHRVASARIAAQRKMHQLLLHSSKENYMAMVAGLC